MEQGLDLYVYYPTQWRRNIGELASPVDKQFRWFMCAKKYLDPELNVYVIELVPGTQFYSIATGKHYVVPMPPNKEWKTKLLLTRNRDLLLYERAIRAGLQGIAYKKNCETKYLDTVFSLCMEAGFLFHPNAVERTRSLDNCALIAYSKANYNCIKMKIPSFPSPEEIDEVLKTKNCVVVCRALYQYIEEYLKMGNKYHTTI